jgi:hypothetical protein
MLPQKFAELLTIHADDIVASIVTSLRENPRTRHYHSFTSNDLQKRIMGIFKNLGHWMQEGDKAALFELYHKFGRTRYYENIPIPDLMYAFTLVKNHLKEFIKLQMLSDTALELRQELQFLERMAMFFDDVMYFTLTGYCEAQADETRKRSHHVHD